MSEALSKFITALQGLPEYEGQDSSFVVDDVNTVLSQGDPEKLGSMLNAFSRDLPEFSGWSPTEIHDQVSDLLAPPKEPDRPGILQRVAGKVKEAFNPPPVDIDSMPTDIRRQYRPWERGDVADPEPQEPLAPLQQAEVPMPASLPSDATTGIPERPSGLFQAKGASPEQEARFQRERAGLPAYQQQGFRKPPELRAPDPARLDPDLFAQEMEKKRESALKWESGPTKVLKDWGSPIATTVSHFSHAMAAAGLPEPGGGEVRRFAEAVQEKYLTLKDDPSLYDQIIQGLSSAAVYVIPGMLTGGVTSALGVAPAAAAFTGQSVSTILASAQLAGQTRQEMLMKGATNKEADSAARTAFYMAVPMNLATNAWIPEGGKIMGAVGEGTQEIFENLIGAAAQHGQVPIQEAIGGKKGAIETLKAGGIGAVVGGLLGGGPRPNLKAISNAAKQASDNRSGEPTPEQSQGSVAPQQQEDQVPPPAPSPQAPSPAPAPAPQVVQEQSPEEKQREEAYQALKEFHAEEDADYETPTDIFASVTEKDLEPLAPKAKRKIQRLDGEARNRAIYTPDGKGGLGQGAHFDHLDAAVRNANRFGNVVVVEADVTNQNGQNESYGHNSADDVRIETSKIVYEELENAGAVAIDPTVPGGDELGWTVVGISTAQAEAAIERAKARIDAAMESRGLTDLAHPKHGDLPVGAGYLNIGVSGLDQLQNAKETLTASGVDIAGYTDGRVLREYADALSGEQATARIDAAIERANAIEGGKKWTRSVNPKTGKPGSAHVITERGSNEQIKGSKAGSVGVGANQKGMRDSEAVPTSGTTPEPDVIARKLFDATKAGLPIEKAHSIDRALSAGAITEQEANAVIDGANDFGEGGVSDEVAAAEKKLSDFVAKEKSDQAAFEEEANASRDAEVTAEKEAKRQAVWKELVKIRKEITARAKDVLRFGKLYDEFVGEFVGKNKAIADLRPATQKFVRDEAARWNLHTDEFRQLMTNLPQHNTPYTSRATYDGWELDADGKLIVKKNADMVAPDDPTDGMFYSKGEMGVPQGEGKPAESVPPADSEPATPPQTINVPTFKRPELVRLANSILGLPAKILSKIAASRPGGFIAGYFKPGSGRITINAETFYGVPIGEIESKDPAQIAAYRAQMEQEVAAKGQNVDDIREKPGKKVTKFFLKDDNFANTTLVHELIHAIGDIPKSVIKSSNLLAHISHITDALKTFMSIDPNDATKGVMLKDEVQKQAEALAQIMRPYNKGQDAETDANRAKPAELYADIGSAMLLAPDQARAVAPELTEAFWNWTNTWLPNLEAEYNKIRQEYMSGTEYDSRSASLREGYARGRALSKEKSKTEKGTLKDAIDDAITEFGEKRHPIYQAVDQFARMMFPKDQTAQRNWVAEVEAPFRQLAYTKSEAEPFVGDVEKAYAKATDGGVVLDDVNEMLQYNEVIERDALKDLGMAEPGGTTAETARDGLDALKERLGPEKTKLAEAVADAQYAFMNHVQQQLVVSGALDPKMAETIAAHSKYIPHVVLDYYAKQATPDLRSGFYPRVGTFREIMGGAESGPAQAVQTLGWLRRNEAKKDLIDSLKKGDTFAKGSDPSYKDLVVEAEYDKGASGKSFPRQEAPAKNVGLVMYQDGGAVKGFWVPKSIADAANTTAWKSSPRALVGINKIKNTIQRFWTDLNLRFAETNPFRDYGRSIRNNPGNVIPFQQLFTYFPQYVKGLSEAFKHVTGRESGVVREMYLKRLLAPSGRYEEAGDTYDDMLTETVNRILGNKKTREGFLGAYDSTIGTVFEGIAAINRISEISNKVATKLYLDKYAPGWTDKAKAVQVLKSGGSPDFLAGGNSKWLVNATSAFGNVAYQSWSADYEAFRRDPKGFAIKVATDQIVNKGLLWAIGHGLLDKIFEDKDVKPSDIIARIPRRHLMQYTVVPIGIDRNKKAVYLTLPVDETSRMFGALAYHVMDASTDPAMKRTLFELSADYLASVIPGLAPTVEMAQDAMAFATGRNPTDDFSGRPKIDEDEFDSGGLTRAEAIAKYAWNSYGPTTYFRFPYAQADKNASWLEDITAGAFPKNMLGGFLRVSDEGLKDRARIVKQSVAVDDARQRAAIEKAVAEKAKKSKGKLSREDVREVWLGLKEAGTIKKSMPMDRVERAAQSLEQRSGGNTIEKAVNSAPTLKAANAVIEDYLRGDIAKEKELRDAGDIVKASAKKRKIQKKRADLRRYRKRN